MTALSNGLPVLIPDLETLRASSVVVSDRHCKEAGQHGAPAVLRSGPPFVRHARLAWQFPVDERTQPLGLSRCAVAKTGVSRAVAVLAEL